jgi:hypothetical protein
MEDFIPLLPVCTYLFCQKFPEAMLFLMAHFLIHNTLASSPDAWQLWFRLANYDSCAVIILCRLFPPQLDEGSFKHKGCCCT